MAEVHGNRSYLPLPPTPAIEATVCVFLAVVFDDALLTAFQAGHVLVLNHVD